LFTKEDIERIANMMRIDIDDAESHLERMQKILDYFDNLDKADVESEDISTHEVTIDELREDEYIPFESRLIDQMKNYKGTFVRAPKMN